MSAFSSGGFSQFNVLDVGVFQQTKEKKKRKKERKKERKKKITAIVFAILIFSGPKSI